MPRQIAGLEYDNEHGCRRSHNCAGEEAATNSVESVSAGERNVGAATSY